MSCKLKCKQLKIQLREINLKKTQTYVYASVLKNSHIILLNNINIKQYRFVYISICTFCEIKISTTPSTSHRDPHRYLPRKVTITF